ncbi:exodeoxyribonuclease VII large subunit [Erysipelothrix urinaevulpis]|uniref:exodeoxyribonuclease VII large subunit n=1 Tax=Erysipelothrix urinaevulpis TaxID=2683717 RepID=UPI0013585908|nr:exodeoxyribonuclease VII large subunit [Erysipelothrix urinaevulpis]
MIQDHVTVSQLVHQLKQTVNHSESLKNVALMGELSNFNSHRSGHFYFTMKDDKSRIDCVMFASYSSKIKFKPKDGDKVLVTGFCDVYLASGKVQFYAKTMMLDGLGDLHLRYEELKKKCYELGYFNPELKKAIPEYPEKIAVITGQNSAAHADITKTLQNRWPQATQLDLFAYVQGEYAAPSLIQAIQQANDDEAVDTIILSRGGGSIEDLWAFNEEAVVVAIIQSKKPVICAIGHESDTTLSELAADYRAATPTAAVVAACPDQHVVRKTIKDRMNFFYVQIKRKELSYKNTYTEIMKHSYLNNSEHFFGLKQQGLDHVNVEFTQVMSRFQRVNTKIGQISQSLVNSMEHLQNQSVYQLDRQTTNQTALINQVLKHKQLQLKGFTFDEQAIMNRSKMLSLTLKSHVDVIQQRMHENLRVKQLYFKNQLETLHHLSPLTIMAKGYSIASIENKVITTVDDVDENDEIVVKLTDGHLRAKVQSVSKNKS